jgi:hypothetical protein
MEILQITERAKKEIWKTSEMEIWAVFTQEKFE